MIKEITRAFINGYIYNLARIITLYLAALYFSVGALMQEAEENHKKRKCKGFV